ncbi:uncharacterized protein LOC128681650 isoform X3 [Plodia interpunctella]|uniref:uncharacterized protein LOC128681650 isoform X3 n=1 Tax=Plodia interpunctella TaxID=58824 RepID=UPI002368B388|nr:uncharacterized protein LOC128681650 isoform X3 [Plodia interpunctella]
MNYRYCSQCNFASQFESALLMHKALHHPANDYPASSNIRHVEKTNTVPHLSLTNYLENKEKKSFPLLGRTSSATKLFANLKARITRTRSRQLFSHPEEPAVAVDVNDLSASSECTSKGLQGHLDPISKASAVTTLDSPSPPSPRTETYGCHLCAFESDRITVLDQHLLKDHKIGLDNLLKLVMAKTKDGLSEDQSPEILYGIKQPYYRPQDERIEEGEYVIETVTPKIKILKHASTNTDIQWTDIPDLKDNCRIITKELDKLMKYPIEMTDKAAFLAKMETLNKCMCKFVDSSNTLKRVLKKEYDTKSRQEHKDSMFDLELGDHDSPRVWERAHSEKMARSRHKPSSRPGISRSEKAKMSAESFYF